MMIRARRKTSVFKIFIAVVVLALICYGVMLPLFGPRLTTPTQVDVEIFAQSLDEIVCKGKTDESICVFKDQQMTKADHDLMANVLEKCVSVLEAIDGLDYFLYGTTILGFYRHNKDFIPWDDFINLALIIDSSKMNRSQAVSSIAKETHEKYGNDYSIQYNSAGKNVKFFSKQVTNSKQIKSDNPSIFWRWPYVEIQIMDQKGSIISDPVWGAEFRYEHQIIKPTNYNTLAGVKVRVPSDVQKVVETTYDVDSCRSRYYDRRNETNLPSSQITAVQCSELMKYFPFTHISMVERYLQPTCELGRKMDDPLICAFMPAFSDQEKQHVLDLFAITIDMLENLPKSSYFLYGGTLIGYWRHNKKMIPWDDDGKRSLFRL